MKIPLILISYNNNEIFKKSFDSLTKNTSFIYELIVVDNNSSDKNHIKYLEELENSKKIKLYKNKKNLFTLGLNICLKDYDNVNNDFFVICDSDFLYPEPINGKCWLSSFVEEMQSNPYIGKLGLSISLENLENKIHLKSIYDREKSFSSISLNANVWAAQVDTTPAIYRKDFFFWDNFRLYPGHMSANKPFYHIGRHKNYIGYHLGWDYNEYINKDFAVNISKIDSFALYGGALDKEVVKRLSVFLKCRYYGLKFVAKIFWVSFKIIQFGKFLLKKKIFFINELLYR